MQVLQRVVHLQLILAIQAMALFMEEIMITM